MKRILFLIALAALLVFSSGPAHGATEIVLDNVTGLLGGDTVRAGEPVRFTFRLTYTPGDGSYISASTNGFEVWTVRSRAIPGIPGYFTPLTYDTLTVTPSWATMYDGGFFFTQYGIDGTDADTVGFGGFQIFGTGVQDGFDQPVWWVETTPSADGDTLCIDSAFYPSGGMWLWSTIGPLGAFAPDWGGPYCFHVQKLSEECGGKVLTVAKTSLIPGYPYLTHRMLPPQKTSPAVGACCLPDGRCVLVDAACCGSLWGAYKGDYINCFPDQCACCNHDGIRGDADYTMGLNVGDLTFLVAYLFQGGPAPPCLDEGDVDGSGAINVGDLTYLVAYLFQGGLPPPACP